MQVILLEKITHLGDLGDIVKVKDGYGRNFLIPQGHAKRGSVTNADIAEAVDKLGFQIKKSQVRTPLGAIKATGEYVITIGLMTDISADVTVKVVAEE